MPTDAIVRARIDSVTKKRAAAALDAMGLSLSDAIRLLMLRIADEKRLPFEIKVPTEETVASMKQLSEGKGKRFESAEALMKDLGL
jgi:DNA-damage-inducible protein J